jgi:hypothetical protein
MSASITALNSCQVIFINHPFNKETCDQHRQWSYLVTELWQECFEYIRKQYASLLFIPV